jgi:hypothetical protein
MRPDATPAEERSNALLASLKLDRLTLNQRVQGSSPCAPTNQSPHGGDFLPGRQQPAFSGVLRGPWVSVSALSSQGPVSEGSAALASAFDLAAMYERC